MAFCIYGADELVEVHNIILMAKPVVVNMSSRNIETAPLAGSFILRSWYTRAPGPFVAVWADCSSK